MEADDTNPTKAPEATFPNVHPPSHYVGIGASAGGLEAIEAFVRNMPPENGLAFIIVQHLSPDYKSLMAELLSKRTRMPVHRVEDGMRVAADAIYLIPPKKNLTIFHGKLILSDPERSRSGIFLPIDIFLRSLAEDQGEKAVGIILSGTGSDGMRGVRAIKESGGMVMVQDESTARFDGMPRSAISTGLADFILPPEEMPQQLLAFVKHPEQTRSARSDTILTDEDGLTRIFALLRERHKIDFTYYKPSTVVRRIERRMTINHINELNDYVRFLESYPRELSVLYRELLIGVTSFFRDPEAFDNLYGKYLPELLERLDGPQARFWVAGCSTGEEAYTLAMICRECLENMGRRLDVKIFATDVDNEAVLQAGNGIYPESIAADLSPAYLSKYFVRRDDSFQIAQTIREMVVFAQHNLTKDPPFTNIDLISCRNLLIYFQPVLQRKVLEHFNFSLNPRGLMMLGHSETVGDMVDYFDPLDHKWKIYRSRGKGNAYNPELEAVKTRYRPGRLVRPHFLGPQKVMRFHEEERILDRLLETLTGDYVPLTLVVNDQLELLHVLGDAGGFLRYPSGRVMNDITRLTVKELSIPLTTGIQKAFRKNEEIRYTNIHIHAPDGNRILNMRIKPFRQKRGQGPLAGIFIENADRPSGGSVDHDIPTYDLDREAAQRIQDLEQELQFTRENLQATIEELETSNEELQATNEELLASNEELQSTNEELQSVNEELHTVNTEHQRKIMELTELNNDIHNLMQSTGVGTLFLDENLDVRKFTPLLTTLFKIADNDVGRSVAHLTHCLDGVDLVGAIKQIEGTRLPLEKEVRTVDGKWFLMRVIPYQIGSESFSGLVMTFIDIDALKRSEKALRDSESKFRMLAENIEDVFWIRAPDLNKTVYVSPAYERIWGQHITDLYDNPRSFLEAIHPEDRERVTGQLSRHTEGFWDVEYRIEKPDRSIAWIHDRGVPIYDNQHRLALMCGFSSDITGYKTREQMCLASVADYGSRLESAAKGIALIDSDGRVLACNPKLEAMLGYGGGEIDDRPFQSLAHPDEGPLDPAVNPEESSPTREVYQLRRRLMCKSGETLPTGLTLISIRDGDGRPNYTIGLVEPMSGNETEPL